MKEIRKIRKILKKLNNIIILMHSDPDLDAMGAAYSLLKFFF